MAGELKYDTKNDDLVLGKLDYHFGGGVIGAPTGMVYGLSHGMVKCINSRKRLSCKLVYSSKVKARFDQWLNLSPTISGSERLTCFLYDVL